MEGKGRSKGEAEKDKKIREFFRIMHVLIHIYRGVNMYVFVCVFVCVCAIYKKQSQSGTEHIKQKIGALLNFDNIFNIGIIIA